MIEQLIIDIPPLTRTMCITSIALTVLTYIDIVHPYNLYFNFKLITSNYQVKHKKTKNTKYKII